MNLLHMGELERDILRESLNLGVGRAAAALSELMGQEIEIYLPDLHLLPKRAAVDMLSEKFCTSLWTVQQYFFNTSDPASLAGHIFLFLHDDEEKHSIYKLIGPHANNEHHAFSEIEILQEIGNILLNACLSGVADLLSMELSVAPPTVHRSDLRPLLLGLVRQEGGLAREDEPNRRRSIPDQDPVIHLLLHFDTQAGVVDGAVMIFMDLVTVPHLKQVLNQVASQC